MKILLVNKFLYAKGGAEIVCLELARQLRLRGHEARLFGMADPRNPPCEDADTFPANIDYHARRGPLRKAGEALRTIYGLQARRGMAQLLDRWRPDLIHMHNIYHQLTPSVLTPARRRGIPVLLTLHDYKLLCPVYTFLSHGEICEDCVSRGPASVLRRRCKEASLADSAVLYAEARLHRLLRSYQRGVSRFSSPSRFLRDKLIAAGMAADRVVYLPNGLPLTDAVLAEPYRAPAPRAVPVLLWVGRMSTEKGLATLLEALASLDRPLSLHLVGDGPEEAALRARSAALGLADRVLFLGRKGREEIPSLILAADGTILPSEWYENAPLSLLESLALGRPILASRLGGVPEMLTDGQTGWLFEAGNPASLGGALADFCERPAERLRRGALAYETARERFAPERILDETLSLYAAILSQER